MHWFRSLHCPVVSVQLTLSLRNSRRICSTAVGGECKFFSVPLETCFASMLFKNRSAFSKLANVRVSLWFPALQTGKSHARVVMDWRRIPRASFSSIAEAHLLGRQSHLHNTHGHVRSAPPPAPPSRGTHPVPHEDICSAVLAQELDHLRYTVMRSYHNIAAVVLVKKRDTRSHEQSGLRSGKIPLHSATLSSRCSAQAQDNGMGGRKINPKPVSADKTA